MDGDIDDKAELKQKQEKVLRILYTLKAVIAPIVTAGKDAIKIINSVESELNEIFYREKITHEKGRERD